MIENKDLLISTLPIKPQKKTTLGMSIAPFLTSFLGETMNARKVLSTNVLHAYDNRVPFLEEYIQSLKTNHMIFDEVFVDEEHTKDFFNIIERLIYEKKIVVKKKEVLICNCGKVDIAKNGIRNYEEGSLYTIQDGVMYCKCCHSKCVSYEEEGLYLDLNQKVPFSVSIFPFFHKKAMNTFFRTFQNTEYLVSKKRDTGYSISTKGKSFHLDIDFLWVHYPAIFPERKQIHIASNHQLFEMFLLNYVNFLTLKKELHFIATPYFLNPNQLDLEQVFKNEDDLFQKLSLLYTLKWQNYNSNWDESILKFLKKLNYEQREYLLRYIASFKYSDSLEIPEYLKSLFIDHINFQKNISLIRKEKPCV